MAIGDSPHGRTCVTSYECKDVNGKAREITFGFSIFKYFWISNWISEMVYESPKALATPRIDLKTFLGLAKPNQYSQSARKQISSWFWGDNFGPKSLNLHDPYI